MFIDYATLTIKAGRGGDGCVSFRREKFVPKGGPDGGDGGKGGDVIFVVDPNRTTLLDFRYVHHFEAENGMHGSGNKMTGRNGKDCIIPVPQGTLVKDKETGEILADLTSIGQKWIAAKGGKGGKGNSNFATSVNRAPRKATPGKEGEEKSLILELKLIADVGLVGKPNAGKSTLLATVTAARPKIADYPFTTLEPNLGIVPLPEFRSFVMADIPGLIEGASQGKGLGYRFLRHIERTRLLLILIPMDSENPKEELMMLLNELNHYSEELVKKPRLVVRSKSDLISQSSIELEEAILSFSAVTHHNIKELIYRIDQELKTIPQTRFPITTFENESGQELYG
ncbi:MAG: GTPase ObgE [bacterium]|nr:GTPase ObgE [bacterium]